VISFISFFFSRDECHTHGIIDVLFVNFQQQEVNSEASHWVPSLLATGLSRPDCGIRLEIGPGVYVSGLLLDADFSVAPTWPDN
jgi:hypothetical protein